MSLVGVCDLGVGSWNIFNCLEHLRYNLDQLVLHVVEWFLEPNCVRRSIHLKFESKECFFELFIRTVVTSNDFLWMRVVVVLFAESAEKLNVLVD